MPKKIRSFQSALLLVADSEILETSLNFNQQPNIKFKNVNYKPKI